MSLFAEVPSKMITCYRVATDTEVVMRMFTKKQGSRVKDNELLYLKVKGRVYFDESQGVVCQDAFSFGGNFGDYCILDKGYSAHVHLSSYLQYSGVILYKRDRAVKDDIHLECKF